MCHDSVGEKEIETSPGTEKTKTTGEIKGRDRLISDTNI